MSLAPSSFIISRSTFRDGRVTVTSATDQSEKCSQKYSSHTPNNETEKSRHGFISKFQLKLWNIPGSHLPDILWTQIDLNLNSDCTNDSLQSWMSGLSNLSLVFLSKDDNSICLAGIIRYGYRKIRKDYEIKQEKCFTPFLVCERSSLSGKDAH